MSSTRPTSLTIPPREPRRTASSSSARSLPRTGRPSFRSDRSYLDSETLLEGESEWDDSEEWEPPSPVKRRRKDGEPTSPITVVFYVVAAYIVWQILTRTDDHEILSHLPASASSLLVSHQLPEHPHLNYPYHLPHLPSPIPSFSTTGTNTVSTEVSMFGILFGILSYPFRLIFTILLIPLPLLANILTFLFGVTLVILSPFILISRAVFETFIRGPWTIFSGIMRMLYPVWVFVGGVLGVGTVLGLCVGWIGRETLRWLLPRKKEKKGNREKRRSKTSSRRSRSEYSGETATRPIEVHHSQKQPIPDRAFHHSSTNDQTIYPASKINGQSARHAAQFVPETPIRAAGRSDRYTISRNTRYYDDLDDEYGEERDTRRGGENLSSQPVVVGIRRRQKVL